MGSPREIAPGVFVFSSSVWQMTSGLVLPTGRAARAGTHPLPALLVDPGVRPGEIETIAESLDLVRARPAMVVLTHCHWDHLSGASRFSGTPVVASACYPAEAADSSREIHTEIARSDGDSLPGRRVPFLVPEATSLVGSESEIVDAPRPVRVLPTPGHTRDGIAMLLSEEGVLFAGDYLSAIEIPYVEHSLDAYRQTLACFRRMILTGRVRIVVSGHGPHLPASDSLRILEEDDAYLDRVDSAARASAGAGARSEQVLEAALGVSVPRATADPEVIEGHRRNAALAAAPDIT